MKRLFGTTLLVCLLCRTGRGGRRRRDRRPLEPRRPHLGRRRAGRGQAARRHRPGRASSVTDDGRDVTSAFALTRQRPLRGPRRRPRPRRQRRSPRRCPTAPARASRSPTTRTAARSSPARRCSRGQCQETRGRRAVQPARRPTSSSTSTRGRPVRGATTRRTRRPTSPRRPPTRARRCPTSSASRPATRTATSTRSPSSSTRRSRGRVGAAGRVQPQAADHPRRQLRDRPPVRARRPDVMNDTGALARLRRDVDGAQQRRPQLQHRHPGRVDGDGEGAPGRAVRRAPLHDRHRLLGRLAHPAAGRQRLSRHLPGDPAAVQLPGRVVDRASSSPPTTCCARYVEDPTKWAPGVVWDAGLDRARSRATPTTSTRSSSTRSTGPSLGVPDDGCPGVPAEQNYNAETNPGGVRCTLADYMINVFGPRPEELWTPQEQAVGHGFAGLPLDNVGVQFGLKALEKGQITPAQFVDLNAKIGGVDIDINPTAERFAADAARARATPTAAAAINQAQQPRPGRDHRPARPRPGRLPRRLPLVGDPRPARARAGPLHEPRDLVRPGAADGRPELRRPRRLLAMDRWLARRRGGHERQRRSREKIVADRPADIQDRCSQVAGVEQVDRPGRRPRLRARAGPDALRHAAHRRGRGHRDRHEQVPAEAAAAQRLLPDRVHRRRSGRSSQTAFPTGVCDWSRAGRRRSRTRSRGRPTRTPTAT